MVMVVTVNGIISEIFLSMEKSSLVLSAPLCFIYDCIILWGICADIDCKTMQHFFLQYHVFQNLTRFWNIIIAQCALFWWFYDKRAEKNIL